MKHFILIALVLAVTGCTSPIKTTSKHNAIIPLGNQEVGVFIPESWKKISPPENGKNVVLMAQNGAHNVVISFEHNDEIIGGSSICKGAEAGLAFFQQIFVDDTECYFSGHLTSNTPLRNFWQKVVRTSASKNFLLISCSSEQQTSSGSQCPEILKSFEILDKIE